MTKKKNKKNIRFRIKSTKPQPYSFEDALDQFAQAQMQAQRYLNPLIIKDRMSPKEAIVLIAIYADAIISGTAQGKEHTISQDDIMSATNLLIQLWKSGKCVPTSDYPYTLEETLKNMQVKDEE